MSLLHIKAAIVAGALMGLAGQAAQADTLTSAWSGTTSTTWSTAGNWAGGVPSTTVGALFNSTFTNQPILTANQTTLGLWLATGVGQDVTVSAASARTILFGPLATFNGLTGTDILMDDSANHNLTFGSNITLNFDGGRSATAIRVNNAGTLTIAGVIKGAGSAGVGMTGTGAGTIDVTGQLGSGGTTPFGVSNVTVILEQANPSMNAAGISVTTGGVLRLNNTGAIPTGVSCNIQSGGILQLRSDTDNDLFTGTYNSAISPATINVDRKTSGSNNTLKIGAMTIGNGATLNVTGANGYNLGINALTVGNGNPSTVHLNPTTANLTIGTMTAVYSIGGGGQNISLEGTTTGNAITGTITDPVALPLHPVSIIKTSSGKWTLSGTSTYTGATSVTGGTLQVDGSLAGTTGVTVNAGTTLQGIGSITNGVTIAGNLNPGNSIGQLTVGSASFVVTGVSPNFVYGKLNIEVGAGTSSDLLAVTGNLNITNADLTLSGTFSGQSYIIATYGSLTGAAFHAMPALPVGYSIDYGTGANSAITLVGIPEPATLGLLAIGGLMMIHRRKR